MVPPWKPLSLALERSLSSVGVWAAGALSDDGPAAGATGWRRLSDGEADRVLHPWVLAHAADDEAGGRGLSHDLVGEARVAEPVAVDVELPPNVHA